MALWPRRRPDPQNRSGEDDTVTTRIVLARLDSIADRQEAVYDRLKRLLNQVSPIQIDDAQEEPHAGS